jgi:hypothetical protein
MTIVFVASWYTALAIKDPHQRPRVASFIALGAVAVLTHVYAALLCGVLGAGLLSLAFFFTSKGARRARASARTVSQHCIRDLAQYSWRERARVDQVLALRGLWCGRVCGKKYRRLGSNHLSPDLSSRACTHKSSAGDTWPSRDMAKVIQNKSIIASTYARLAVIGN